MLYFRNAQSGGFDLVFDRGTATQFLEAPLLRLMDGLAAPATAAGGASIYVDAADGALKVKFGRGTVKNAGDRSVKSLGVSATRAGGVLQRRTAKIDARAHREGTRRTNGRYHRKSNLIPRSPRLACRSHPCTVAISRQIDRPSPAPDRGDASRARSG